MASSIFHGRSFSLLNRNVSQLIGSQTKVSGMYYFSSQSSLDTHPSLNSVPSSGIKSFAKPEIHDVFIIGGGVTGTALFYYLSRFTNLSKIGLCERRKNFAMVASAANNNSQTIHCGDIETNYSLSKATSVQKLADMLRNYATKLPQHLQDDIIIKCQKMVMAVGDTECNFLEDRFNEFKKIFPRMQLVNKSQLAELEPRAALMNSHNLRPDDVNAIFIPDEHTAINYNTLSMSFIEQAKTHNPEKLSIFLNTEATEIIPESENLFTIKTKGGSFKAKYVVVSACGHSLMMAHRLGYGLEYSCMPVSGSFYFTPPMLNGKVYTVQNPELPFAAVHGDPDVVASGLTRFGPTALPLPMLERYNTSSIKDFLEVLKPDAKLIAVYWDLMKKSVVRNYVLRNFLFEIPFVSSRVFLKDARKIVPSLKLEDLTYAEGFGGVRPQLIDKITKKLIGGEGKIAPSDINMIFNITPSPGGTTCMGTAHTDAFSICKSLGASINQELVNKELFEGEYAIA